MDPEQTLDIELRYARGIRAVLAGLLTSVILAVIKILSGLIGNSYALIADGIESALDVISAVVVAGGLRIASVPPDHNHPYGHGRAEPLAALIVAMILFGAALGIAIQSIREIRTPHHAPEPFTLIVLLGAVITKEMLFRFILRISAARQEQPHCHRHH